MTFSERLRAIRADMMERRLDILVAIHDGVHFIETPNPVMVLTGFKSIGPAAAVIASDGGGSLWGSPAWGGGGAGAGCSGTRTVGSDDVVDGLATCLATCLGGARTARIGLAGLSFASWGRARRIVELLPTAEAADGVIDGSPAIKTEDEIANAREATRIAELGYRHLLDIARPGVSEDEL